MKTIQQCFWAYCICPLACDKQRVVVGFAELIVVAIGDLVSVTDGNTSAKLCFWAIYLNLHPYRFSSVRSSTASYFRIFLTPSRFIFWMQRIHSVGEIDWPVASWKKINHNIARIYCLTTAQMRSMWYFLAREDEFLLDWIQRLNRGPRIYIL